MRVLTFTILTILFLICGGKLARPQSAQIETRGKCVIAGRVMAGESPVRDATVIALFTDQKWSLPALRFSDKFAFRAKTDADGHFRIANLQSGIYQVGVLAPTMVNTENDREQISFGPAGKRLVLADDEVAEAVNFSLVRGGVITGRVTFADGRPAIAETITLMRETAEKNRSTEFFTEQPFLTDDRGIYRIYGLPDGRYHVSVGNAGAGISARNKNQIHRQSFYPGVTDEAAAQWIEIKNGNEVGDVDIKIGAGEKAYTVAGIVVDADSGKALSDFMVSLNAIHKRTDSSGSSSTSSSNQTNSRGEFKFDGLFPGSYVIQADERTSPKQYYSEVGQFELSDANLSGLTVKVHRGLTVSGTVSVEGITDLATVSGLSEITVLAWSSRLGGGEETDPGGDHIAYTQLKDDGSFTLSGVRPGKLTISTRNFLGPSTLAFLRLERNGLNVTRGIEVNANEPIADLRIVMGLANCRIRGQVKIEGGSLLKDPENWIGAHGPSETAGDDSPLRYDAHLDPTGHFSFEGVVAGEYEFEVEVRVLPDESSNPAIGDKQAGKMIYRRANLRVSVAQGEEAEVTVVIKASE